MTKTLRNPDVAIRATAAMGEGPSWDIAHSRLIWVDTIGGLVHVSDIADGGDEVMTIGKQVGAAVPNQVGSLVLACPNGIYSVTASAHLELIAAVEADSPDKRLNDAKCDQNGRLWTGSLALDIREGAGSLYRLDPDRTVVPILSGLTISNGMDWSPDTKFFYFIDSMTAGIDLFDFDLDTGSISNRRRFINVPREWGLADGMTTDADGGVWVAIFGAGVIHRYTTKGELDVVIELPVSHPTSCCFAGSRLDTLIVTTARADENGPMSERKLRNQPLAGSVFAIRPGVFGMPATPCAC